MPKPNSLEELASEAGHPRGKNRPPVFQLHMETGVFEELPKEATGEESREQRPNEGPYEPWLHPAYVRRRQ